MRLTPFQPGDELGDGRRLIPGRRVVGFELKEAVGHVGEKLPAEPTRRKSGG
jgi:hypothetical protein